MCRFMSALHPGAVSLGAPHISEAFRGPEKTHLPLGHVSLAGQEPKCGSAMPSVASEIYAPGQLPIPGGGVPGSVGRTGSPSAFVGMETEEFVRFEGTQGTRESANPRRAGLLGQCTFSREATQGCTAPRARCVDWCRPCTRALCPLALPTSRRPSVAPRRHISHMPTYLWPGDTPNRPSRCLPWPRKYMLRGSFRSPGAVCPLRFGFPHLRFVSHPAPNPNICLYFSIRTFVCISHSLGYSKGRHPHTGDSGPVSFGAGEGSRTPAASLEGWSSTVELHPHVTAKRIPDSRSGFKCIHPTRSLR